MKKIVAAVAALFVAGSAFAQVSFSYKGTGIVDGNPKAWNSVDRTDCLALQVSNDTAGVIFDMDIVDEKLALDEFYGWMTFALPVGNLQITSGKYDGRNVNRVNADAGALDGAYFEKNKPGVINGTVAKDAANLTAGKKMSTVLAYTIADPLPGKLMAKFGLINGDYGKFDSKAGFVGELSYAQSNLLRVTASVRNLTSDALSLGLFVSPTCLDALSATVGFSFGKDKVGDENKTEFGIDARARYALTRKVALTGMFNFSKTNLANNAKGEEGLMDMWTMAALSFNTGAGTRVVASLNHEIKDFVAERGNCETNFTTAVEMAAGKNASVTVAMNTAWSKALYSGKADFSMPVYVKFAF